METVYNKTNKFLIDGIEIELVSENISEDIFNTYYIIDGVIYCLGNEEPDIQAAILSYENFFNVKLSDLKIDNLYKEYLNENFR